MKVVLLAGGLGTRLKELTEVVPKPMVEIGGQPILWHIMKLYSFYGFHEFVILLGYKGYYIKEYFANYFLHQSDVTIDLKNGNLEVHNNSSEPWKVTLLDTGEKTMTGGRIKRAQDFLGNEPFMLTYGDVIGDINLQNLVDFHQANKKAIVTITSIQPEGRFGVLKIDENNRVNQFLEKPKDDKNVSGHRVNAGFFVCESEIFNYIPKDDEVSFELDPLRNLAKEGKVFTHQHKNFWHPMDTLRDKEYLQSLWNDGKAPWKIWT